jgi:NAD(P)H-hydrate epimerase
VSLDVPSGLNATTGETPGQVVRPERTLTLALPKTGLHSVPGDLYLADIGIPPEVYEQLGLGALSPFGKDYWIRLRPEESLRTPGSGVSSALEDEG